MDECLMTQRMGPNSTTQQLTAKPESFSNSQVQEESFEISQRIADNQEFDDLKLDQTDRNRPAIFLMNKSLRFPITTKQSSFLQHLKNQINVHRFIDNLFTNSYILRSKQKAKIPDRLLEKPKSYANQVSDHENKRSKIPIFLPSSHFIIIWDVLGFIAHLIMLWLTPFLGSFINYENETISYIQRIILIFLIIDFLIQFNKGIIISAIMVSNRKKIIKEYLKTNALADFIKLLIWGLITYEFSQFQEFVEIFVILQILLLYKNIQKLIFEYFQYLYFKGNQNIMLDLIQLIIQIYFFAHIIACIWHYVGVMTQNQGSSWIMHLHLENASVWSQYNAAFYWATMTMTTVGYGDITAQNQVEMIISSIVMFLSSYAFAYTMSSIGIILKSVYDAKLTYKQNINQQRKNLIQITQFMNNNQVDPSVQGRIRNYLKLQLLQEKGDSKDDINTIINSLPPTLQQDLHSDIQNRVLKKMKLIINHFSKYTQQLVAQNLELISFIPGDIIYKQGDQNENYLQGQFLKFRYFIQSGEVMQLEIQTQQKLRNLKSLQYLGYYAFFTGFPPKETAISVGPCQLYKISRQKFIEIIKQNRKDFEIFHHMKDKMIFKANYVLFDHKCNFCNRYVHQEIDCPLLQYKPDLESFYKKEQFAKTFNKRRFQPRITERHSTLGQYQKMYTSLKAYQEDNQLNVETEYNNEFNLQNQKSMFSEKQPSSQNVNSLEELGDLHSPRVNHLDTPPKDRIQDINTPKNIFLKHQGSAASHKRSSFSKMKIGLIDQKPSSRKNFGQAADTAMSKKYNMLQQITETQSIFKNQMNVDRIGLNLQFYMPYYSIESQIKLISKSLKKQNKRFWRLYEKIDKYTFSRTVKEMAVKLTLQYKKNCKTIHQI